MNELGVVGRALPIYILGPVLALFAIILYLVIQRTPSAAGRFVVFAVSGRFFLSALHEVTYRASPLGLSWNALASVAMCGIGVLTIRKRSPVSAGLLPFYFLIAVMVVSGFFNGAPAPLATALTKFGYLIILMLATVDALEDLGAEQLCRRLIWAFAVPLTLQAFSIVMGLSKPGEDGGAASYIGGFHHEAGFSLMIASGLLTICLAPRFRMRVLMPLIVVFLVSIVAANYRTAILGLLPLVCGTLLVSGPRRFVPEQRGLVFGAMLLLALLGGSAGVLTQSERFADLGLVVSQGTDLIQRPETFSDEQGNLMSGRPMIWSQYYYAWSDAGPVQHFIGLGPETWGEAFAIYAHNTLISNLYETGISGVVLTVILWIWMFLLALRAPSPQRWLLVSAHLGFLILNMATMPMWMIEGMIFYGLLCGFTLYGYGNRQRSKLQPRRFMTPDEDLSVIAPAVEPLRPSSQAI